MLYFLYKIQLGRAERILGRKYMKFIYHEVRTDEPEK
jgi:hypothetical protein